jgi:hypothetical protein
VVVVQEGDVARGASIVAAEKRVIGLRAEFLHDSSERSATLAAALDGSPWDQVAALNFLREFPDDGFEVLEKVFDLSLSQRWAGLTRDVIGRARGDGRVAAKLQELIRAKILDSDADEYRRIVELAAQLQLWDALQFATLTARESDDGEIRDAGIEVAKMLLNVRRKIGPEFD